MKKKAIQLFVATLVLVVAVNALGTIPQVFNGPGYVSAGEVKDVLSVPFGEMGRASANVTRGTPSEILFGRFLKRHIDGHFRVQVSEISKFAEELRQHEIEYARKITGSSGRGWVTYKAAGEELLQAITLGRLINERVESGQLPLRTDQDLNSNFLPLQRFYETIIQALEIWDNLRADDTQLGRFAALLELPVGLVKKFTIRAHIPEAVNLKPPDYYLKGRSFVPPKELDAEGLDLSGLDPVGSGFWSEPDPSYDTRNYNNSTRSFVGSEMLDPEKTLAVEFAEAWGGTGVTPKFKVSVNVPGSTKPVDVKLKLRGGSEFQLDGSSNFAELVGGFTGLLSEVQTETAVNNLAAALGYNVQPTYVKNRVNLYLPDDGSKDENLKDLSLEKRKETLKMIFEERLANVIERLRSNSRSRGEKQVDWNYAQTLSDIQYDEMAGRWYVALPQSSIEFRLSSKGGFFSKHRFGKSLKREFRAFEVFHALVSDVDRKDSNTSTELVKTNEGWKIRYVVSDLGSSLGWYVYGKGSVNLFSPDLVSLDTLAQRQKLRSVAKFKGVPVEYPDLPLLYGPGFLGPMMNAVSTNDARWIVRRMLKLSPAQLRGAFEGAGYHQCLTDLYVAKLERRIHQLAYALGLANFRSHELKVTEAFQFTPSESCSQFFNKRSLVIAQKCSYGHCQVELFPSKKVPPLWTPIGTKMLSGDQLVHRPPGVVREDLLSMRDPGPQDSMQRAIADGTLNTLAILGGRAAGQWMERIRLGYGSWFEGWDARSDRGVGMTFPIAAFRIPMANPFFRNRIAIKSRAGVDVASSSPYWIADVFRCGFGIGSRGGEALGIFPRLTSDVSAMQVMEFIRIRPSDTKLLKNSFGRMIELADPKALKKACVGLSQDYLKDLAEDDVAIHTIYRVVGASERARQPFQLGPNASVGVSFSKHNRIMFIKGKDQDTGTRLLAIWDKGDRNQISVEGNYSIVISRLPLLGAQLENSRSKQQVAILEPGFDIQNPDKLEQLLSFDPNKMLRAGVAASLLPGLKLVEEKKARLNQTTGYATLFGFQTWFNSKRKVEVEYRHCNPSPGAAPEECEEKLVTELQKTSGHKGWNFLSSTGPRITMRNSMTAGGILEDHVDLTTYFSFNFRMSYPSREDVLGLLRKLKRIYPASMVPIDPENPKHARWINDNHEEVTFEGPFVVKTDGWKTAFEKFKGHDSQTLAKEACKQVVSEFSEFGQDTCSPHGLEVLSDASKRQQAVLNNSNRALAAQRLNAIAHYVFHMTRAVETYRKTLSAGESKVHELYDQLRARLVNLLYAPHFADVIIRTVQSAAGPGGYRFFKPTLKSALEGLGQQGDAHELDEAQEGSLSVKRIDLSPLEQLWSTADFVFDSLKGQFYDYHRVNMVDVNLRVFEDWKHVSSESAARSKRPQ